jgi:hypothetical protein
MISQRMHILWPDKTDLSIYQTDWITLLAQIKDLTVALMRGGRTLKNVETVYCLLNKQQN